MLLVILEGHATCCWSTCTATVAWSSSKATVGAWCSCQYSWSSWKAALSVPEQPTSLVIPEGHTRDYTSLQCLHFTLQKFVVMAHSSVAAGLPGRPCQTLQIFVVSTFETTKVCCSAFLYYKCLQSQSTWKATVWLLLVFLEGHHGDYKCLYCPLFQITNVCSVRFFHYKGLQFSLFYTINFCSHAPLRRPQQCGCWSSWKAMLDLLLVISEHHSRCTVHGHSSCIAVANVAGHLGRPQYMLVTCAYLFDMVTCAYLFDMVT